VWMNWVWMNWVWMNWVWSTTAATTVYARFNSASRNRYRWMWWKARVDSNWRFSRFVVAHWSTTAWFTTASTIFFWWWRVWVFVGRQSIVVLTVWTEISVLFHIPFRPCNWKRRRSVSARITSISHLLIG
jgi:hypothetical protein